jgi:hypothetical protein
MIPLSKTGGGPKKRRKRPGQAAETGFRKHDQSTDTLPDSLIEEIDPADFFDPEEFGMRHRDAQPYRP